MISHEFNFIQIHIPFTSSKSVEEEYVNRNHEYVIASDDTKKLAKELPLEGKQLAKTIKQFYDYELFAIVKNPYLRAFEMWHDALPRLKEVGLNRMTLGKYYENLLNKWQFNPADSISKQSDYLRSSNGKFMDIDVEVKVEHLFKYEFLKDGDMTDLNNFLNGLSAPSLPFYYDNKEIQDDWDKHFDGHAIEIVNYIYEEDFDLCGYRKL